LHIFLISSSDSVERLGVFALFKEKGQLHRGRRVDQVPQKIRENRAGKVNALQQDDSPAEFTAFLSKTIDVI